MATGAFGAMGHGTTEEGLFGVPLALPAPSTGAPAPGRPVPRLANDAAAAGGQPPSTRVPAAVDRTAVPRKLPPLATTEFQRFVAETSGHMLPIYGSSLFADTVADYTPLTEVPVPANYVIGPGDEVLVRSTGVVDMQLRLTVDRNGQVVLPKVGPVQLAGVRVAELEAHLTREVGRSFRNFTLSAALGQLRSIDVYVVGRARMPGKLTVSSLASLVNAIFLSGGPDAGGSMRRIRLMRQGKQVTEFDLYRFIIEGDGSRDERLLPGDVIVYTPAGARVALLGSAPTQAIFELAQFESNVDDLLSWAGGLGVVATPQRAMLERIVSHASAPRSIEEFALDASGRQLKLRDGDVVTLLPISPEFANAVTLRGNVAQPLRHPYRPGLRVRDLIPDASALIPRDYYRRKNLLVQPAGEPRPAARPDAVSTPASAERDRTSSRRGPSDELERPRREGDHPPSDTEPQGERATGRRPADADRERPTDRAAAGTGFARGRAQTPPDAMGGDVRNLLDEVNWDYAVIERLDRRELTTRLIPFNLRRAVLEGDPAHDLELQPGDVITILGKRDLAVPQNRQTRLVRIEGEVAAPGIYETLPGETLASLLSRVGGLTREAYVYGTSFSRDSVRRQQRQNLEQLARRLEEQVGAAVATRQSNLSGPDGAVQSQQVATEERLARERLQRLKSLQPDGRIALELDPRSPSLPSIALEDGDRIIIPARPSFVQAVGAVYNDNALLWREGRSVSDYLKVAGLSDSAELEATLVLRADGSIVAADAPGGFSRWFSDGVLDLVLQPGDTIVVPEKVDRETRYTAFMRGLKDWTQILYQLGLGVAAIKVLR